MTPVPRAEALEILRGGEIMGEVCMTKPCERVPLLAEGLVVCGVIKIIERKPLFDIVIEALIRRRGHCGRWRRGETKGG